MKWITRVIFILLLTSSNLFAFELLGGKYRFYNDLDFMLHVPNETSVMINKSVPWQYRIDYVGKWTIYDRVFIKPIFSWDLNESFDTTTWNIKTTIGAYVVEKWSIRYQFQDQNHKTTIHHVGLGVEF